MSYSVSGYAGAISWIDESGQYRYADWQHIFSAGPASTPVPEPATMLLLGSGLIGFAGIRRKFKE